MTDGMDEANVIACEVRAAIESRGQATTHLTDVRALAAETRRLRKLIEGLCERIASQCEILARLAEKKKEVLWDGNG